MVIVVAHMMTSITIYRKACQTKKIQTLSRRSPLAWDATLDPLLRLLQ